MLKSHLAEILQNIDDLEVKFGQIAGTAFIIELKMRLIGQLSKPLQSKLKELKSKEEYWECDLEYLDNAIETIFFHLLTAEERRILKAFRMPRNKLLHQNFAGALEFLTDSNEKNTSSKSRITEALALIEKSQMLENLRRQADLASKIFDKIIFSFGTD